MNCVPMTFINARWQIEAALDEHTAVTNPRIRVLLNRRLDGSVSGIAQSLHPLCPDLMTGLHTRAQCN